MKTAKSIKTIPIVSSIEDLPFPDRAEDRLRESGNIPSVEPGTCFRGNNGTEPAKTVPDPISFPLHYVTDAVSTVCVVQFVVFERLSCRRPRRHSASW